MESRWHQWLKPTGRKVMTLGLVSAALLFGGFAAFNWLSWLKNTAFADLHIVWCIVSWLAGGLLAFAAIGMGIASLWQDRRKPAGLRSSWAWVGVGSGCLAFVVFGMVVLLFLAMASQFGR